MSREKKNSRAKSAFKWTVLVIIAFVITSFLNFLLRHHINPLWAKLLSHITGKQCCYNVRDPMRIEIFAKHMTKLINTGYIISFSPDAAKVKIAPAQYECQETYFGVAKNVLDRNSGNLQYTIDNTNKVIHIMTRKE